MTNRAALAGLMMAGVAVAVPGAWAQDNRLIHLENTAYVGYDDNISYSTSNELDGVVFRDDLVLSVDKALESGFIGLRYRASYQYYEALEDDPDYLSHSFDAIVNHSFYRRLTLGLVDSYMFVDRPEVINADGTVRKPESSYTYNTINGSLSSVLGTKSRLDLSGRWQMLRYQDERIADLEDYDIYGGGVLLGTQVGKDSTAFIDTSIEDAVYGGAGEIQATTLPGVDQALSSASVPDRGFMTYSLGLGLEKMFSPSLMGKFRAGYMMKEFEAANTDSESAPYGEAYLTILPAAATRLTLGASHSMYQSAIQSYANQSRTTASASLGHDLSARFTLNLSGTYIDSQYDSKDSVLVDGQSVEAQVGDGAEQAFTLGLSLAYRMNRNNWLQAGLAYTDYTTEYESRSDYNRMRYDFSWRVRL